MRRNLPILLLILSVLLQGCSTTRVLKEGQYRLSDVEVSVSDPDGSFSKSDITQYIKQKPNPSFLGLHPLLYVYNWGGEFFTKIGQEPVVYSRQSTLSSEYSIRRHLRHLGYFDSKVTSATEFDGKLARVRYGITLGPRIRIDSVVFNVPGNNADFFADTANVTVKKGSFLSEQSLEAESARASAVLRTKGYYGLGKSAFFFIADTLSVPGKTILEYGIRPAQGEDVLTKYRIGKVNVSLPSTIEFRRNLLDGLNRIKPGDVYDERLVSNTYNRFSSVRILGNVAIEMNPASAGTVDCDIRLKPGKLMGFKADLEASTNSSGLIGLSPQLNFYHRNIFHGGETLNLGFTGNFQFMLNAPTRAEEFGMSAGIKFPRFLGISVNRFEGALIPSTEVNLSFNYQDRPEYTRNVVSGTFGYSGQHSSGLYYSLFPLQLNYVRLFNLDGDFSKRLDKNPYLKYSYQDHFDCGVGGMLYYNSSKDVIPKGHYNSARLQFDMSGLVLSAFNELMPRGEMGERLILGTAYSQYARFELSFGGSRQLGGTSLALRVLSGLGFAYGNSTAIPYEKQFYAGGAAGMRGWQARALGPGAQKMDNTFSIPSQTGDLKIEADLEWRFPIVWKLEGALFAEVGNVWNMAESNDILATLAADWGLGIRVNLDVLLLRVDWGIQLRNPSAASWLDPWSAVSTGGSAIHFGVGYPF